MDIRELILRRSTPVVINSFNQHCYLQNIVAKFLDAGFLNLLVFDNGSTYPPLVDYLNRIRDDVRVMPVYYNANMGPRHFFLGKIYASVFGPCPFLYTDPDLTWGALADDFVSRLLDLTHQYRTFKVGAALTLPHPHELKASAPKIKEAGQELDVIAFESRYWQAEVEPGVYNAPIDTTLHLFNPAYYDGTTIITGLRVAGAGYEAKHTPWFKDDPCPAEETDFYKQLDPGWRNWV
ncbi:MAG: hypothetical protein QM740_10610 [Acidovorax sp.]